MELLRALAVLAEPPSASTAKLVDLLDLGEVPSPSDFTEAFVLQLYPYASVYLGAEGMLGGEARDRIAGFWRAVGRTPPKEPDHLTALLALYAQFQDLATLSSDDAKAEAAWRHRARALLWEHLLSWLPFYLQRLREIGAPFYRVWAKTLLLALKREAQQSSPPELLPSHLRDAPELADPREDAKGFLPSLLSPARSGLILTRHDLARASRDLAFGLRLGERRFILQTLLEQAADETLAWLIEEAKRQATLWQQESKLWILTAEFWQKQALSTARFLKELS